jgi:hypothetical protein
MFIRQIVHYLLGCSNIKIACLNGKLLPKIGKLFPHEPKI